MATLPGIEPTHVGDYELPCPKCGDVLAVPVFVEVVEAEPSSKRAVRLGLRASFNSAVIDDHVREHGRLSRLARR